MIDAILRGSDEGFRIESTGASQDTALGISKNSSMELTLRSQILDLGLRSCVIETYLGRCIKVPIQVRSYQGSPERRDTDLRVVKMVLTCFKHKNLR